MLVEVLYCGIKVTVCMIFLNTYLNRSCLYWYYVGSMYGREGLSPPPSPFENMARSVTTNPCTLKQNSPPEKCTIKKIQLLHSKLFVKMNHKLNSQKIFNLKYYLFSHLATLSLI